MSKTKVIGLTGGIGSGKSTISAMLKNMGAYVIDEDILSRMIMQKGQKAYEDIIEAFCKSILTRDGEIDRKKLGNIVFKDKSKLKKLNELTHPHIIDMTKIQIIKAKKSYDIIVVDAPLLIEAGMLDLVDTVWVVYVDKKTQIERVMHRDGITEKETLKRIDSQMCLDEKIKYADFVIDNTVPIEITQNKIKREYEKLKHNII